MSAETEQAIKDLNECDETQGGVLRALRLMAHRVYVLEAEIAYLKADGATTVWEALAKGIETSGEGRHVRTDIDG